MATSTTTNANARFEDWRARAIELQQGFQSAQSSWLRLVDAASGNKDFLPAANAAGLAMHESARAYNAYMDSNDVAQNLAQDIYRRLQRTDGPTLTSADRRALEIEQQKLLDFAYEFQQFEYGTQGRFARANPDSMNIDGKTYHADGRSEWDDTPRGLWGQLTDSVAASFQSFGDQIRFGTPEKFEACKQTWETLQGVLLGKALPGPGSFPGWLGTGEKAWGELSGKTFSTGPAETACRLIYPKDEVPDWLRLIGSASDGYSDVLGDLTAIDVPASSLASAGLADVLSRQVAIGAMTSTDANAWLTDISGDADAAVPFTYRPPSTGYSLLASLSTSAGLDADLGLWTDGGPMSATVWQEPAQTVEYEADATTWRTTDLRGQETTTTTQVFDDGSSITTTALPDGATRTTTRDTDNSITSIVEDRQVGTTRQSTVMDGAGNVVETRQVQTFDDGSSIRDVADADGNTVHTVIGSDGRLTSVTGTAAPLQSFGTAIQDLNSLVNAIRAGRPLPVLNSGLTLIDNQVNPTINGAQTFNNMPLYTTTAVVSAATSLYSLHNAFSGEGTDVQRFTATANAIVAFNTAANAVASEITGTVINNVAGEVLTGVAGGISTALPFVNIALSLKDGNYVGAAVGVAAMAFPVVGWVYAAYTLITAINDEPPEAWASGHFRFAAPNDVANAGDIKAVSASGLLRVVATGTSQLDPLNVQADIVGDAFGPERVRLLLQGNGAAPGSANYFGGVLGELDRIIDAHMQAAPDRPLGIIPQRLPTLSWHEARQNDPGYSVTDIDPLTGQERLPQLRYNDDWTPYNADPTDPVQRLNVFERLVNSAVEREAIAPLWEVQTARLQQDIGDPNAGLTEEVRAAHRNLLAPVDAATQQASAGVFRPVALDLNGDGRITTVTNAGNNRAFNWDGSGYDKEVGWVGGGEGLLFVDRNLNGAVDNGKDLFSNSAVADAAKGVRSLALVDANADGVLNSADPVFAQLKVWQDADGDAVADQGELKSLSELGITSLDYANGRFTRNGQYYAMQSPTLEASAEGTRAAVLPEGIRVEFSDGTATLYVTSVTDLGAGNDGIAAVEDGGQDYDAKGKPQGQASTRHNPISILPSLLLQNDSVNGSNAGLVITAVGKASVGSVSINAQSGAIQFLAPQHFNGEATFEYTVKAPDGQTKVATVTVNVAPVNDRPVISSTEAQDRRVYGYQPLTYSLPYLTYSEGDNRLVYDTLTGRANGAPLYSPYITEIKGAPIYSDTGNQTDYTPPQIIGYQPSTYVRHDAPGATERATRGKLVVSDVEGDTRITYKVVADGLYGRATVNADGSWSYEAYRPNGVGVGDLNADGSPDYANPDTGEVFTNSPGNAYLQNRYGGDEASASFIDKFTVRATAADGSIQDVPIEVMHYGPRPLQNVQSGAKKPIAIDLNGDGFHFTDVDDSNVFFDVNGDGWRRRMAWNNPQDGLLAFDKNGDGKISDFDEISFVPYDTSGQTDLESLRKAFDTNGDGVFSAADAKWNSFGVWQDANSNGVSDPGEFRTLSDLGISQIGLTSDGKFQVINGQSVHGTATATKTDGSKLAIADVTLRYRNETQVTGSNGQTTTVTVPTYASGQQITGTAGADLVFGTSGNDQYVMGDGNDVINDDGGNDLVDAGAGDDLVFTGADDDYVDAGAGKDTVFTGAGNDIVIAGDGDDFVSLEGGNDIAFVANGNDMLSGGFGNDLLSGDAGMDKLFGEGGWDQLFGGAGDDELWGWTATTSSMAVTAMTCSPAAMATMR